MYGALSKPMKALFEGAAAWLAVIVLSSMIYWMATKGKELKNEIEKKIDIITTRGAILLNPRLKVKSPRILSKTLKGFSAFTKTILSP